MDLLGFAAMCAFLVWTGSVDSGAHSVPSPVRRVIVVLR